MYFLTLYLGGLHKVKYKRNARKGKLHHSKLYSNEKSYVKIDFIWYDYELGVIIYILRYRD